MILPILGMATSLAGTIASAAGSAVANNRRAKQIEKNKNEDNLWYMKEFYQDPTQRSDNQAILTQLKENLKEQQKQQQAQAKISGATAEAQLASANDMNKAYSDVARNMSAMASQRRDLVGREWRANKRHYADQEANLEAEKAQQWGNVANNAAQLGASAIMGFGGLGGTKGNFSSLNDKMLRNNLNTSFKLHTAGAFSPKQSNIINPFRKYQVI